MRAENKQQSKFATLFLPTIKLLYYIECLITMNKYSWTGTNNIFCWSHTRVNSLVMLASHECVLQKLLKDPQQTIFFVVGFSKDKQQIGYQVKQICIETQICHLQFKDIEELKEHLQTNPIENQIIIICSPDLTSETQLLLRKSQFLGAIQFRHPSSQQPEGSLEFLDNYFFGSIKQNGEELQSEQDDANTLQMFNQQSEQQSKQVFIRASKKQELLDCITKLRKKRSNYKDLPNFVCLREEIQKSNILTDSIALMSNQTVDKETRSKILQQLVLLSKDIASVLSEFKKKKKYFQLFIDNFKSGNIEPLQVIRIYTSEEYPIYGLINNFLRALDCPTQIFYIQPIFKDLFTAISELYHQNNKRKFVCYRGGIMFEREKHRVGGSVGEIVQNLGFISTSLSDSIANLFMKNVMYEIHVDTASENQANEHYEFGYADISCHSFFFSELQVLFNPLNYFKVREMKRITMAQHLEEAHEFDEVIRINLSLGQVTRIMNKQERQLEEDEKIIKMMIHLQKERQAKYQCQGNILSENPQKWELRYKYWKYYYKIAELKEGKIIALKELGNLEVDHQNLTQAQNYYGQIKQLVTRNQHEHGFDNIKKIKYLSLYHYISAEVYSKQGKFAIALQLLHKAQQKILQIGKQSSPEHLSCLLSIGINLQQLYKFQQALQVHLKCANYCFQRQGQYHPDYLVILDALVRTYFYHKNFHYALIFCKKLVVLSHKMLGSQNVLYIISLRNLGNILKQHKQYEKSLSIFCRCASLIREVTGEQHQSYWFELRNIALCYQGMGKLQDALCIYKDIADKFLNKCGCEHPDYILCLSNKANILYLQHDYSESINLYRKVTQIRKRVLGEFHPLYLNSLNNISKMLHKIGEYKQSLEIEQECLGLWKQVDGKGSARQVLCLYDIAHCLSNLKRQQEAILTYKQMLIVWLIKQPLKCLIYIIACFHILLQSEHIGNVVDSWLFEIEGRFQKALMSYLHVQPLKIFSCFELLSSIYYRMKEYKKSMKVLTSISSEQVHLSKQLRARIATEKQLIAIRISQQRKKAKMLNSFVCYRL